MKILIIEDNISKKSAIQQAINEELSGTAVLPRIASVMTLNEARRKLWCDTYDLIVFDMYLPDIDGGSTRDCSQDLITEYSAGKNYKTEAIALTQFEVKDVENIQSFNCAGITLVHFDTSNNWKSALKQKIGRVSQSIRCDFLIFCALPKERHAFSDTECQLGDSRNISGMDCTEANISGYHGFIIKPSGMGLVNMAIVSSKAIELFQPKIVAMSGICAGVEGESNYLDIIVGRQCWEYQTGKWKDGVFCQEPYQSNLSSSLQVDLEQSSRNEQFVNAIKSSILRDELDTFEIRIAPISSGSAVIADEELMNKIGLQHRKMAGLEMEMYSLYTAAEQSLCQPLCFGAKTVVDLGTNSKGDELHMDGCLLAARYVTATLKQQLSKL
ncbi:hypothetical protein [Grimontia sp. SpTr1]|uniref:phosphorylase family protein n=1 Tax=Grimontia sp. SpTr1 TaxID=2995319 RepID=UPI00248A959F|nr:hypothetical protein [Grimontia sp. SpTr1]